MIRRLLTKLKDGYRGNNLDPRPEWFMRDLGTFVNLIRTEDSERFDPERIEILPFLNDKTSTTSFDTHYIYHPAWAARVLKGISPSLHIDIGSTLHFSTLLSAFIPTRFYDYRPAYLNLTGLSSETADLTNLIFEDNTIETLSCMHTIEHVGLGRYGDHLDAKGDLKAMKELQRVVRPGGSLLLVTPVGKQKILFNGHRIYSFETITQAFDKMALVEFSLIPDNALEIGMIFNCPTETVKQQDYGCGCFWFRK